MQKRSSARPRWIRAVIVLLSVLLAASAACIGALHLYGRFSERGRDTAVVPDNIIGSRPVAAGILDALSLKVAAAPASDPTTLSLYKGQPFENVPFDVTNMLPGDTYVKEFCIRISHKGSIVVYFWPQINSETKSLGDVLNLKVTRLDTNEVLCDTTFRQQDRKYTAEIFPGGSQGQESIAYYKVEVSMDTSVGNDYQAASLNADFYWSTEVGSDEPDQPDPGDPPYYYVPGTPPDIPPDQPGELIPPPQTGDTAKPVLWAVLAVSSLGILLFLILRRRKEDDTDE